jgi:hypothetical protein
MRSVTERGSGGLRRPQRTIGPKLCPIELKAAGTRREVADEINRDVLGDNGELLLEADEMDFDAVRLDPARPPMRVPTLRTGGSVGHVDGICEQILNAHPRPIAQRKPRHSSEAGVSVSGEQISDGGVAKMSARRKDL